MTKPDDSVSVDVGTGRRRRFRYWLLLVVLAPIVGHFIDAEVPWRGGIPVTNTRVIGLYFTHEHGHIEVLSESVLMERHGSYLRQDDSNIRTVTDGVCVFRYGPREPVRGNGLLLPTWIHAGRWLTVHTWGPPLTAAQRRTIRSRLFHAMREDGHPLRVCRQVFRADHQPISRNWFFVFLNGFLLLVLGSTVVRVAYGLVRGCVIWLAQSQRPGHVCATCGYDLRAIPSKRCPECGTAFDPARMAAAQESTGAGDG